MHLKSLTLKGFKSFASATTLRLEPGITCVVGPNGSGKSNVVDAIAWVLGEQGAKALRGGKMEDVIFAGTAGRAPLGRAEVTLTIDNSDGALPIEYSEVSITRRTFRDGAGEYEINGQPCRLLDVQELLSDSGIGREMHVIVGQGRLELGPGHHPGLRARPGAELRRPRPDGEVRLGLGPIDPLRRPAHDHLPADGVPGKNQADCRIHTYFSGFAGFVVGVEYKPALIDRLQQHGAGARHALPTHGGDHHRVRLDDLGRGHRLGEPPVELRQPGRLERLLGERLAGPPGIVPAHPGGIRGLRIDHVIILAM